MSRVLALLSLIVQGYACVVLRSRLTATLCRSVSNTTTSGTIGDVQSANHLENVFFENTMFSGTVPDAFSDFPRLEYL